MLWVRLSISFLCNCVTSLTLSVYLFLTGVPISFQILKLDEHKGERLVHMYLFIGADSQEQNKSINHQLAQSELWQKLSVENNNNTVTGINSISDSGNLQSQRRDFILHLGQGGIYTFVQSLYIPKSVSSLTYNELNSDIGDEWDCPIFKGVFIIYFFLHKVGGDEEKLTLSGSVVASTHAAQVVEESSFTEATTKTILPPQLELPLVCEYMYNNLHVCVHLYLYNRISVYRNSKELTMPSSA